MATVLKRLQKFVIPGISPIENGHWVFSSILDSKPTDFFRPNLKKYQALQFEYAVLCTQLRNTIHINEKLHERQLIAALILAEYLEFIFLHYFGGTHELENLRKNQQEYRKLLSLRGITFSPLTAKALPSHFSRKLRLNAAELNWMRLLVVRGKKIFSVVAAYLSNAPLFKQIMSQVDKYANPFFNYFAWIFFIPRSFVNTFIFFKRTLPTSYLTPRERDLKFIERVDLQAQRRGFELGNDVVWLIVNAILCFLLVAGLALIGTYFNAAFFVYDVVLTVIRIAITLKMFFDLKKDYESLDCSIDELDENFEFKNHFQKRKNIDLAKLFVSLNSLAALAIVVLAVAIASHPLLPLIAAVLLFAITAITYLINNIIEKHRPKTEITETSLAHSYRLFKPATKPVFDNTSLDEGLETFIFA